MRLTMYQAAVPCARLLKPAAYWLSAAPHATRRRMLRGRLCPQVVIPRLLNTINYINSELDEMEREEIFRIKKVLELKRKHEAEEDAERAIFQGEPGDGGGAPATGGPASGTGAGGAGAGSGALWWPRD